MSKEQAKEFVEKFWNDDEFMRKVFIVSGAINWQGEAGRKMTDEEQNQAFIDAAKKFDYDITPEEYGEASKEYADNLGGFEAIKKVLHMAKVAKKARETVEDEETEEAEG